jgi:hypothetical protein
MGLGFVRRSALVFIAIYPLLGWAGQKRSLQVFVGEITDSHCAKVRLRSSFTSQRRVTEAEKKACALKCIERGSKVVLFNSDQHTMYTLDDPEKVLSFAGQKVRITGILRGNDLTIATIENVF